MDNVTITNMGNGYYRIAPDAGYKLYSKITGNYYSETVTKDVSEFEAVEKV
jgi:hypothetical protein